MSVDEQVREALDVQELLLPSSLTNIRLEPEDYTDSEGEEALRILVVLDESTDVEKLTGETIGQLKSTIRESLRAHGVTKFPYIFLAKPSELAEASDEDEG
jgi:hypothetical protein